MADQENQGTIINVKRVTEATGQGKAKDQDKHMFCVGLNKDGSNEFDKLLDALEQYRGKQVNFDFRVSDKQTESGVSFRGAFLIVKEMIPRAEDPKYAKKSDVKAKASAVRAKFGKPAND